MDSSSHPKMFLFLVTVSKTLTLAEAQGPSLLGRLGFPTYHSAPCPSLQEGCPSGVHGPFRATQLSFFPIAGFRLPGLRGQGGGAHEHCNAGSRWPGCTGPVTGQVLTASYIPPGRYQGPAVLPGWGVFRLVPVCPPHCWVCSCLCTCQELAAKLRHSWAGLPTPSHPSTSAKHKPADANPPLTCSSAAFLL